MEKQSLFQYVVLQHPTLEESKQGVKSKVLVGLTEVLSIDQKSAALVAAMTLPAEARENVDQLEIIVRPF
jgi:hypothetical protein